jgi:uncharacterized protein (DUF1810 family)
MTDSFDLQRFLDAQSSVYPSCRPTGLNRTSPPVHAGGIHFIFFNQIRSKSICDLV